MEQIQINNFIAGHYGPVKYLHEDGKIHIGYYEDDDSVIDSSKNAKDFAVIYNGEMLKANTYYFIPTNKVSHDINLTDLIERSEELSKSLTQHLFTEKPKQAREKIIDIYSELLFVNKLMYEKQRQVMK